MIQLCDAFFFGRCIHFMSPPKISQNMYSFKNIHQSKVAYIKLPDHDYFLEGIQTFIAKLSPSFKSSIA